MAQMVKSLPAMWETWVQSLDREDPLEKEMAIHSSILTWKIPWMEEPNRLQSMGFFRQKYWSGLPFPSPGDIPEPEIESRSPALQADALPSEPKPLLISFNYSGPFLSIYYPNITRLHNSMAFVSVSSK